MIWVEDTQVKIGSTILPGLLKSIEVTGASEIEEQEVEGSSSKKKQAMGYEDAKVTIELVLEDGVHETKYVKLTKLQNLFRKAGQEKPIVYNIVSEQTAARNVSKVIFKTLTSKEDSGHSKLTVSIELWEYEAMTVTATQPSTQTATTSAASGTAAKPVATAKKAVAATTNKRGISRGGGRGKAPKQSAAKKETKSPAKDTKSAATATKKAKAARGRGNSRR